MLFSKKTRLILNLYKYREVNDFTIEGLVEGYFWASSREALNDPCECYYSTNSYNKFIDFASSLTDEIDISNFRKQFILLQEGIKELGIFSLSKSLYITSLWAHYSGNHKGICIEYDLNALIAKDEHICEYFDIDYSKIPPDLGIEDVFNKNLLQKIIGTKSLSWRQEEEFRLITDKQGKNYYSLNSVKSIIFGLFTSAEGKNNLMKLLCDRNIQFKQLMKNDISYDLYAENIDNPFEKKYAPIKIELDSIFLSKELNLDNYVTYTNYKDSQSNYSKKYFEISEL